MTAESMPLDGLKAIAARAMRDHELLPEFSPEALRQAQNLDSPASRADNAVRDLRALLWCSIDNDDSRDLDQLSVAEALNDGGVKLLIAVADVDVVIERGSPIDDHAQVNTTSVYTAAGIFPMLPEKISTDLTSLIEGQDRFAIVVEMTVAVDGALPKADVYRARVLNRAKLAYRSVAAWLEGTGPMPAALAAVKGLDEQIRMQDRAADLLRRTRDSRGALSLETSDAQAVFAGSGLSDLRSEPQNRAQRLIADLMIAANGVVARYLRDRHFPSIRRALPPPARWDRIVALAAERNAKLPATPDSQALSAFLSEQRSARPDTFADLSLSVVKLLGAAEYMLEPADGTSEGHFGLAVQDYTHSTAPNRRFPDLITQRLLKALFAGREPPYSNDELATLAAHCNEQSRNASKVERQISKCAAALLLQPRVGQEFDAIVTGSSSKGTWVRITHPATEGKVVQGAEGLDVGDRVRVRLEDVDGERGFIDFARVDS